MNRTALLALVLLLPLLSAAGCSKEQAASPAFDAGSRSSEEVCDRATYDTYVAGFERASSDGTLRVAILDAVPAPPSGGENQWRIRLTDGSGAPVTTTPSIEVTDVARGLSAVSPPVISPGDTPGVYLVQKLELTLTGTWQIRVVVGNARVDFSFCVES